MRSTALQNQIDWNRILATTDIPEETIDNPEGTISGRQELQLQRAFANATRGIPGLWFRMGLDYRLMCFGPLGMAALASGTLGAGLRYMSRFRALTYSLIEYRLVEENGTVVAIIADDSAVPEDLRDFSIERGIASATQVVRDMHPGIDAIKGVRLAYDATHGRELIVDMIGCPVEYSMPNNLIVLDPKCSEARLPMANPLFADFFARDCARLIDNADVSDAVTARLIDLLVHCSHQYPSAAEAAATLGLSERTLFRRLASQNTTFGQVLDQVRDQRAQYLLSNTALTVEQLADALGYRETASFSRAFKRWTGVSPNHFRLRSGVTDHQP